MSHLSIPAEGLLLLHGQDNDHSKHASVESAQVIRLDLAQKVTNDLLESLRNKTKVQLNLGKRQSLYLGKTTISLHANRDRFPSELFKQTKGDDGPLYFTGKFSHTLEVQKAKEATAKADTALAALESNLKSIQEQKASNETSFVRNQEEMKALQQKQTSSHRPSPLLSASSMHKGRLLDGNPHSVPGSPSLGASFFSRLGPTSAPLGSSISRVEDKIKIDAITIPLLHLLAVRPMTLDAICKALHAPKQDCDKLMHKYARDSHNISDRKELKEKSYRELDVWKFPYKTQEDRQLAIDHAIQAFDRTRIDKKDQAWQLLLPESERGKGKCLSKLNFDKPVPSHGTPRLDVKRVSPDDDSSHDKNSDSRGRLQVKSAASIARAKSHDPLPKKKASDKDGMSKHAPSKGTPKVGANHVKSEGKFKSAETIEDSDEEMEAAKEVVAKRNSPPKVHQRSQSSDKTQSTKPTLSPMPKKSFHKSKLSTSSIPPVPAPNRPRTNTTESSPPTSSTDQESSSTKRSSQSSATSSPPSSTDMPRRKTFSPVVSEARRTQARGRSPAKQHTATNGINERSSAVAPSREHMNSEKSPPKRKAVSVTHDDSPPAKRQQLINGTTQRPPVERKKSEVESISSPEKPERATAKMLDRTHRFRKYYDKYKTLHENIEKSAEKNKGDLDDLWKMHNRLKEMKKEIWDDYRRLGEPAKIELG